MKVEIPEPAVRRLQRFVEEGRYETVEEAVLDAVEQFVVTDDDYEAGLDARLESSRRSVGEGRRSPLTMELVEEIKREGRERLSQARRD
jgi:Arc/MetJ-type ribon-helix-helix transcriptional regulator